MSDETSMAAAADRIEAFLEGPEAGAADAAPDEATPEAEVPIQADADEAEAAEAAPDEPESPDDLPEGAAGDPDTQPDEAAEKATQAPPDEGAPRTFKVKLDGQEIEVDEAEVVAGYQRQADYTRKTQALAEEKRRVDQQVQDERQQAVEAIAASRQALEVFAPPAPTRQDWATDPGHAGQMHMQHQEYMRTIGAMEQTRLAQARQAQQEAHMAAVRAQQEAHRRLPQAIPEWGEPSVANRESGELRTYLADRGFAPDVLNNLYDPEAIAVARKAMLYDRLQAAKPAATKRVASAPAMVAPGPAKSTRRPGRQRFDAAKAQLRKTGSIDDAAAAFMHLED